MTIDKKGTARGKQAAPTTSDSAIATLEDTATADAGHVYNYPAVADAMLEGRPVWLAQNRTDADALIAAGLTATHTSGWDSAVKGDLRGAARVIICYRDTDKRRGAAWHTWSRLRSVGVDNVRFRRPPGAESVCAFLTKHGVSEMETTPPAGDAPEWIFSPPPRSPYAVDPDWGLAIIEAPERPWAAMDLGPLLASIESGEPLTPPPTILRRTDGQCLFYPGKIGSLSGEPESCKGWIVLAAALELIESGRHVLYIDCEDDQGSVIGRLFELGATADRIREFFHYVRAEGAPTPDQLADLVAAEDYALVVIDSLTPAYSLFGLDGSNNKDAATFLQRMARPFAKRGAAVVLIDHQPKDRPSGKFSVGAVYKLGGVAYGYTVRAWPVPSRTNPGRATMTIAKDRPSRVGKRGTVAAVAHVVPENGGESVSVIVTPPDQSGAGIGSKPAAPEFPDWMLRGLYEAIAKTPGISQQDARARVHGGNNEIKRQAILKLRDDGHVTTPGRGLYANPDKPYPGVQA